MVTIVNLASNQKSFIHPVRIATYYRVLGLCLWRLGYLPRSEIHWRQPVLPRRWRRGCCSNGPWRRHM